MRKSTKILSLMMCVLFLIAPFSALTLTAETESRVPATDTVPRVVLGELFTGLWCGWCKYAEQAMDKVVNDTNYYDQRFVLIQWHNNDKYAISEESGRRNYYGDVTGFPTAKFDGGDTISGVVNGAQGYTAATEAAYKQKINGRPTTASTFIEIDAMIANNQITVWVNATLLKDTTKKNIKIYAVVVEDENVWEGAYPIRMTAKDQVFAKDVTMAKKGDTGRATGSVALGGTWNVSRLSVIGWVQGGDKEVMNTAVNYFSINQTPLVTGSAPALTIAEDGSDSSIKLDTLFTDPEGDPITYYYAQGSAHINATMDANKVVTVQAWADWFGQEDITLQAADAPNCPAEIKVPVTVTAVNDAPLLKGVIPDVTMIEGTTKADVFNLNTYFSDIDNPTLVYTASGYNNITVTIKPTGMVTIVAPVLFAGETMVTFKATDDGALFVTDEIKVKVTDVNFAPKLAKAIPDVTVDEDKSDSSIKLGDHFTDVDSPVLEYTVSGNTMIDITVAANKTMTIKPQANWNGEETITVSASDTINPPITDQFKVTVNAVNDAPELTGTAFPAAELKEDEESTTEASIFTLFKDVDGDPLSYSVEGGNEFLTITLETEGKIGFDPTLNWFGEMDYVIKATDAKASAEYTAHVKVTSVNDPVVIDSFLPATPSATIKEGDSVDFSIVASDVDAGTTLNYVWTVNDKAVDSITAGYKLTTDFTSAGTYNVKVVVTDGELSASKTWTIKVTDVNRKPTVTITSPNGTDELKNNLAALLDCDASDPDGDTLTYTWTVDGTTVGTGKSVSPMLLAGAHTIKVIVNDGKGGTADASVNVNVKNMKKAEPGGGGFGAGMGTMLLVGLLVVVIVIVLMVVIALKMKGKKATPADPSAQVPPPAPSMTTMDPNAPTTDPYYGQQQPPQDSSGYYNQQQPPQ